MTIAPTSLLPGIKGSASETVGPSNCASAVGSGLLDVYSTPSMIALIEKAASQSVAPCLNEGEGTVGIHLDVSHLAATPPGHEVRAETELLSVEGRVLTFRATVWSDVEKVGEGTHQRCVIRNGRFMEKVAARYGRKET